MAEQKGQVAFIGLGVMGFPMAGHLVRAGYSVNVYNRTSAKAELWCVEYAEAAAAQNVHVARCATPALAAQGAEVVFVCVGNDDDVRQVVMAGDGVLSGMNSGALLVDHTSASQDLALELSSACQERDLAFLDAPVSGGQAGAENGALTVMVGGSEDNFKRVGEYFEFYAKKYALMGPAGAGQLTKMVNQICIAGVLQGLSEGVHFAQQAGLDVGKVVDVISQGAAQSWQMNNRASTMSEDEYEFGFAVDWMRKDLSIALAAGRSLDARLPMTALVDQFYADVQEMGGGRWDTSSLLRRFTART
jgi:3-hydroxyisobutyrate dehydrogenase-like beta-hydroxyacid dehydrogenase